MTLAALPGLHVLPVDVTIGDIFDIFPGRVDVLDLAIGKRELFEVAASTLDFPVYARPNWDSFEECLNDLSWLPPGPRVLVITGSSILAERDPDAWDVSLAVWARAVRTHARGSTPLHVFLID